jgi:hypothetical protein
MKNLRLTLLMLPVACCLLLPQNIQAQHTYSYSATDYDALNNVVNGYGQTQLDYNTQVYYGYPSVQSKIMDANGNQLALQSSQTGSVALSVEGNGSSSYSIVSGHWMLAEYHVSYGYSPCNGDFYDSAYDDYYNYEDFEATPSTLNIFGYYDFFGPGPPCFQYEPDQVLGQSTSTVDANALPAVEFTTAMLYNTSANFTYYSGYQSADLDATRSGQPICGNLGYTFQLTVSFHLPDETASLLDPPASSAKGFGGTNDADFLVTNTQLTNVNLGSTPKSGQMIVTAKTRTSYSMTPPYNGIQVTVSGRYGSGGVFSNVGTVHISCP